MGNFREDLKKGEEMEEVVRELLNTKWFSLLKNPQNKEMDLLIIEKWIEVKFDEYAQYSGNFYIEFESNWKPSWIFREETVHLEYWAHTDGITLNLLEWDKFKERVSDKIGKCRDNKSNTSRGFRVVEQWGDGWRTKGLLVPVEKLQSQAKYIFNL